MDRPDSSRKPMPARLPESWTAKIFAELRNTYGVAFDRQWECPPGQDPADFARGLLDHWAVELRAWGTDEKAYALRWALDNLPPAPPNLVQFKQLVRGAPAPVVAALSYTPNREKALAAMAKVATVVAGLAPGKSENSRRWAATLAERHRQGFRLTHDQKQALIAVGALKPEEPRL